MPYSKGEEPSGPLGVWGPRGSYPPCRLMIELNNRDTVCADIPQLICSIYTNILVKLYMCFSQKSALKLLSTNNTQLYIHFIAS